LVTVPFLGKYQGVNEGGHAVRALRRDVVGCLPETRIVGGETSGRGRTSAPDGINDGLQFLSSPLTV
jgi:hypothetical protein